MVRPAIMVALEKGSAHWNASHWVETNHFSLTDMSLLISYMRKGSPPLLQVRELSIRPVLHCLSWAVRLVLCFSETHVGFGASSGTSHAWHTWELYCLLGTLLSSFLHLMVNPAMLSLLYLLFEIAITFNVQTLSCSKKQWMAGYIMPIFPWSSWMKKVLNFSFPSLSREIHWIVLMQHHWPACYTACFAFSLLSLTTGCFFLLSPFALHCLLCISTSLLLSPIPSLFLPSSTFCYFLFFLLLPMHFPDVLPCWSSCLCCREELGQKAASLGGFTGRLCRDSGPISTIRSSSHSSKDDRVCMKDH